MFNLFGFVSRILGGSAHGAKPANAAYSKFDPLRIKLEGFEIRARMLLERALQEGDGDPIPTLLQALEGPDDQIKATAAQLIGDVAPLVQDDAARREVVQALVNALACPPLLKVIGPGLAQDLHGPLRVQSAEALGKYHDLGAVLELSEALRAEHPPVRRAAAWALGEIGAAEAVDALVEALPDRDSEARDAIQLALRRIGTQEALAAIEQWKQTRSRGIP